MSLCSWGSIPDICLNKGHAVDPSLDTGDLWAPMPFLVFLLTVEARASCPMFCDLTPGRGPGAGNEHSLEVHPHEGTCTCVEIGSLLWPQKHDAVALFPVDPILTSASGCPWTQSFTVRVTLNTRPLSETAFGSCLKRNGFRVYFRNNAEEERKSKTMPQREIQIEICMDGT